jgi:hypothetical protein
MRTGAVIAILALGACFGCASQGNGEDSATTRTEAMLVPRGAKARQAVILDAYQGVELVMAKSLPPQFHVVLTGRADWLPALVVDRIESRDGRLIAWLSEAPEESERLMIALGVLDVGSYVLELRRSSDQSLLQVIILQAS